MILSYRYAKTYTWLLHKSEEEKACRQDIQKHCHLQVPEDYKEWYIDILYKYQDVLSVDKYNLGLAKGFTHKIHLKSKDPVYRKQFKIPEVHHQFIQQTLDE